MEKIKFVSTSVSFINYMLMVNAIHFQYYYAKQCLLCTLNRPIDINSGYNFSRFYYWFWDKEAKNVTLLPSKVSFCITVIKVFNGSYVCRTATCLTTVVFGKQGSVPVTYFHSYKYSFRTVTHLR